jgi:hypothetical protein
MRLLCLALAVLSLFFLTPVSDFTQAATVSASELQPEQLNQETLSIIFSGTETMHYSVSWSGGVKIGDIYLKIRPQKKTASGYVIAAKVKDYGPLSLFYPVDDKFRCFVDGPMKLPTRYEVEQKEGYGRETIRLSEYDQEKYLIRYRKNQDKVQKFLVDGTVYNEFASFIITRALAFKAQDEIIVPTFADKKRHEVKVAVVERNVRDTLFGQKKTLKVEPRMKFKGLYEKSGSTLLWLTDDRCRVPVEIHSRIVVGSLVAELVEYTNSACPELQQKKKN